MTEKKPNLAHRVKILGSTIIIVHAFVNGSQLLSVLDLVVPPVRCHAPSCIKAFFPGGYISSHSTPPGSDRNSPMSVLSDRISEVNVSSPDSGKLNEAAGKPSRKSTPISPLFT